MHTDDLDEAAAAEGGNAYAILEPHARRPIRALLRTPDNGHHNPTPEQDALWRVVYEGAAAPIAHETALAIEAELVASPRTVRELLDGWRPAALTPTA